MTSWRKRKERGVCTGGDSVDEMIIPDSLQLLQVITGFQFRPYVFYADEALCKHEALHKWRRMARVIYDRFEKDNVTVQKRRIVI